MAKGENGNRNGKFKEFLEAIKRAGARAEEILALEESG